MPADAFSADLCSDSRFSAVAFPLNIPSDRRSIYEFLLEEVRLREELLREEIRAELGALTPVEKRKLKILAQITNALKAADAIVSGQEVAGREASTPR